MSESRPLTSSSLRWSQQLLATLGVIGVLLGTIAWAMSSPVGGSPDDDFHLGSIWCPRPIEDSGCDYVEHDGVISAIVVPETIASAKDCMAFKSHIDASCADDLSDDYWISSYRFDTGGYPAGFYRFHHLFVGDDVHFSAVVMRIANILIGVGGLAAVAALARPQMRHRIIVSALVSWVPMGVYFIGSNNPSSWTISGCLIFAAALLASLEAKGRRRWGLLALGGGGMALVALSRFDGAFYVVVILLAVWLLALGNRIRKVPLAVAIVLVLVALSQFANSPQLAALRSSGGWPVSIGMSTTDVLVSNLLTLPEFIGSLWGLTWGPGWFDVPLSGWSTLTMIFVAGGLVFAGLRELWPMKVLSSVVVAGALLGIPVVSMTLRHVQPVYFYQGRYMLPLLAVVFLIWLARRGTGAFFASTGEIAALSGIAGVANALALHSLIVRYTVGTDAVVLLRIGEPLWWPWNISPTVFWILGSLAMMIGFVALLAFSAKSVAAAQLAKTIESASEELQEGLGAVAAE